MQSVQKHILGNGLTILVYPVHTIPKVSVQLWYGVGSKDEKSGQRGLAHLLEHMIFKGTDILSESDINLIAHKLSGNCNAFTSYDYTGYLFDFPKQNWHFALPLLANCMRQCVFKEDLLNAELKAVIQELKMYKDDYRTSLCEQMISAIFADHPYHYPIIGFKQDLWSITRKGLLAFYAKHYVPNNATLVIVGDVDPRVAFEQAQSAFAQIPADLSYKKENYHYTCDIGSTGVTLGRDVSQPMLMLAWVVPGIKEKQDYIIDLARWVLAEGKGSILYKKLVDELELASDLQADLYDLFDYSVFFVHIDPIDQEAIPNIEAVVRKELELLRANGVSAHQLTRASKQARLEHLSIFENNQKLAYEIGKLYLATGNENAIFQDAHGMPNENKVNDFFRNYLRPSTMHKGMVLPFDDDQKEQWLRLQEQSDKQDEVILSRKVRESTVECGVLVEKIIAKEPASFAYPKAIKSQLANGLALLTCVHKQTPKIDLLLELKASHLYDDPAKAGLFNFMSQMLLEGTHDYNEQEFADAAESRGIGIDVRDGAIAMTMLKDDLSFALELLYQMLLKASFEAKNVEKVRAHILADIANFWDSPLDFAVQLARAQLYKKHPYANNLLGNAESVQKISWADLLAAYKKYVSPDGARLAMVGDIDAKSIQAVQTSLSAWQPLRVADLEFPPIEEVRAHAINYPINRDQTVLCFAGNSVARFAKDYDALILFDQIFTGGVLGSMSSYLFTLREQTGLFYTIGGSLVAGADNEPGIVFIRTLVSNDRLEQAQQLIGKAITESQKIFTKADVEHARNALINSMVENFESNHAMANAFLFIDRFGLQPDYFDRRIRQLQKIDEHAIKEAVGRVLDMQKLLTVRIGRVE